MGKLNHENIIKLYETIDTEKYVFLILELCDTDLYSYINNNKINESTTKFIIKQIIEAIKYIMDNNIVHRDLKPHNILINTKTKKIKICDFGFAKEFKDTLLTDTVCGSPLYMAPELLQNQKYNIKSDIWSIGIIMYEIVMKDHPFKSNNISDLIHKINNNKPILTGSNFSYECKELINNLLIVDYTKRLEWEELFNNKWIYNDTNDNNNNNNNNNNNMYNYVTNSSIDYNIDTIDSTSSSNSDTTNYTNSFELFFNEECDNLNNNSPLKDINYNEDDYIKQNNNVGCDYVFVNKPVSKNVLDTFLDNSNEIIKKIKKNSYKTKYKNVKMKKCKK